jgi:hypothetical protein
VLPISLAAALATRMLLLPPPTQHMLAPGCPRLLRLAVEGGGGTHAAAQLAALLWMLARGGGAAAPAGLVRLPPRRPAWLEGEALLVEGMRGDAGCGNVLLLGPPRQVAAAAAAELLRQLRRHVGPLGAAGGEEAAEGLAPVADACHAAIQLLLEERQRRAMRGSGAADSGSDDDEEGEAAPLPLLLGQPAAVEELGGLAAELCQAGTAAGAAVAAALSAALGAAAEDAPGGEGGDPAPAAAAAALLAVSNQFLEAADRLLGCGCLAAGAAQRLDGACQQLEGALRQVQRLCLRLPRSHPLLAAVGAAMEAAPALWQPDSEEAGGGSDDDASSDDGGQRAARSAANRAKGSRRRQPAGGSRAAAEGRQPPRGRRRLADVRNPALRAMLAEEGCGAELEAEDLSDLEDFIVCNPGEGRGAGRLQGAGRQPRCAVRRTACSKATPPRVTAAGPPHSLPAPAQAATTKPSSANTSGRRAAATARKEMRRPGRVAGARQRPPRVTRGSRLPGCGRARLAGREAAASPAAEAGSEACVHQDAVRRCLLQDEQEGYSCTSSGAAKSG